MATSSKIEWTDATWNPTSGCTKVSPGCDNCYAMRFAERFRGISGHYYEQGFDVLLRRNMLGKPASWKQPRRVFVNSMSDLFHAAVPSEYIDHVFEIMECESRHTYQILTKRPDRMRHYIKRRYGNAEVPAHIWLGTSVENNAYAWRSKMLSEIKAAVHFLSIEPMIGPVDLVCLNGIQWVIAGGESGPGFRPLEISWLRDLRDRCRSERIAFFFKQWHKSNTGRLLDGRTWSEYPQRAKSTERKQRSLRVGRHVIT